MASEIEIKYLIKRDNIENVVARMNANFRPEGSMQLENVYFDTPEQLLSGLKMGLRIRRWNDQCEQTLKTAGYEEGGLSERPEHNAPCNGGTPDLTRFPTNIWPQHINPETLNQQLKEQFRVNFTRQAWLFEHGDTLIEIALDSGEIRAGTASEPVAELELELKHGSASELKTLAADVVQGLNVEPGKQSKAQRGYALLGKSGAEGR